MERDNRSVAFVIGLLGMLIPALLTTGCSRPVPSIPETRILAIVGDRIITTDEFIRRAEYTLRPAYCKQDNYIHRKIVLNSLIAEKLLALEAGDQNDLATNTEFRNYIKGRQEQAMRQAYYVRKAWEKAAPDTALVRKVYDLAGRKYRMHFLRLPDEATARQFLQLCQHRGVPFDSLAMDILGDAPVPSREIGFMDDLGAAYHEMIFSEPLTPDQLLGPLQSTDGSWLVMKVAGWTTQLAVSERDMRQRYQDSYDQLKARAADQIYSDEVARLMRGKRMVLEEATFFKLAEILAPLYLKHLAEKKEAFNRRLWNMNSEVELDTSWIDGVDQIRSAPLLTYAGKTWTVADLQNAIQSHPLVFRRRQISRREFPEQLKLAIADLLRDLEINAAAYAAGYDRLPEVRNYTLMWHDNLLAMYQRNRYLERSGVLDDFANRYEQLIEAYLNPVIDSLQAKYSDMIRINTDAFENIRLTNIDLFALQKGVAYPVVSPAFPLLTTDSRLDYGSRLIASQSGGTHD